MKPNASFPNGLPRRRAFSSTLIAVLAIVFISGVTAVLIASSFQQRALLSSFESRKVANHFRNSVSFLNASFRDALVDYEFNNTARTYEYCYVGWPSYDFLNLNRRYLSAALRELSSSGVYTNYANLVVQAGNVQPLQGFDVAYNANASFSLFVEAGNAKKNESVFLEQRIDVNTAEINNPGIWVANVSGLVITVLCPTPIPTATPASPATPEV